MPSVDHSVSHPPEALTQWAAKEYNRVQSLGFSAGCSIWQRVRCAACLHEDEITEPWEALPNLLEPTPLAASLVRRSEQRTGKRCVHCNAPHVFHDGSAHAVFAPAAHRDLLVAIFATMHVTSDGVVRTETSTWQVQGASLTPIPNADDLYPLLYDEARARKTLAIYPLLTLAEVRGLNDLSPTTRAIVLREYAERWEAVFEYGNAWECTNAALQHDRRHAPTLIASARLLERAQEYDEASQRLHRAWDETARTDLLEPLMRNAWRARKAGLVQQAASALLEHDHEAIPGWLGLITTQTAQKITPMRRAFARLAELARDGGHGALAATAELWQQRLLPSTPDWPLNLPKNDYLQQLAKGWREDGYTLTHAPLTTNLDGLALDIDAEFRTPDGGRRLVWLIEGRPDTHTQRAILGVMRRLLASEDRREDELVVLSPHPLPWSAIRALAATPDARIELLLDADHTMQVLQENIETFREYVLQSTGTLLTFDDDALDLIDLLITRWRQYGFGEITHTLACLCASWLAEFLRRRTGGRWVETTQGPDGWAWMLNNGTLIYLIAQIRQSVALDDPTPTRSFITRLLDSDLTR